MASDGVFNLYEGNAVTWGREEALASVQAAVFLDLPAPSPELAAQWRAAAPTLSQRVRAEFLSLKARPASTLLPPLLAGPAHAWLLLDCMPANGGIPGASGLTCTVEAGQTGCLLSGHFNLAL